MSKGSLVLFGICLSLFLSSAVNAQETSPVDFNEDGEVNFADFIAFARGFGKTDRDTDFDARLDLNGNGEVDFQDFVLFARQFGGSGPPADDGDREPFDPPRIYIADFRADRVYVVDAETNFYDPALSAVLSQPRGVIYSYLNRRIYVAGQDSFYALTESSEIDYRLPLRDPPESPGSRGNSRGGSRMALSPDHRLAYVTEDIASQVEVIDIKNAESVALIPLSLQPSGIAISPDGDAIYVGHRSRPWISVIDGPGQALADSIRLDGRGNGRCVASPEGDRIYTSTTQGGDDPSVQIVSIDPVTKEVVDLLEVAPDSTTIVYDLKASRDGRKLYASVRRLYLAPTERFGVVIEGYFWTVDSATLKKTSEIRVEGEAVNFGVSRDGKTAYVAVVDPFTGVLGLTILDLENNAVLGAVPVTFLSAFEIRAYGAKPALGRTAVPEITIF